MFMKIYHKGSVYMVESTIAETITNMQFVVEMLYDNAVSQSDYQEVYDLESTIDSIMTDAIGTSNAYKTEERKAA